MDFSPLNSLLEFLEKSPVMNLSKKFIVDDLAILKAILIDTPQEFVHEHGALLILESIARAAGSVISSFDLKKMNEDMAFELEMHLFVLLNPVRDWKYEARLIYDERPKPSRFYHPRTSPLVFIDRLVENLEELMKIKADLVGPLSHFISQILQKLQVLSSRCKEDARLVTSFIHLAYEAEYTVDSFLVKDIPLWYCVLSLLDIINEFELLDVEATDDSTGDDDVVGFKVETKSMLDQLTREPKKLCIISVVGMAGQGKTTLAKKLYNNRWITDHFTIRAWCCVSQVYSKREVLLELLRQIIQISDKIRQETDDDLAIRLRKSLLNRRFLIYLDDMWKIDAWNDLKRYIPNDNNGSRIMFTTRIHELASEANSHIVLQALSPLSDSESWELLGKKVFQKEKCPSELMDLGKQIAKNCKGLPLSVVLTAGILAKLERKEDKWKQIAETLSSLVLDADAQGIIDLSYTHLSDNLKLCFLYFGAFLEDKEVPVRKLLRFWTGEGFIKRNGTESLEDIAQHYLNDLIGRSLVTIGQKKSNGGVKSCHVHDLLRDFCLSKATEENFLQLVRGYDKLFSSTNNSPSSTPTIYYLRRVCIYSKRNHFVKLKPSGPLIRTLIFGASNDTSPNHAYDISFISDNFKLLRILDFEDINTGNSFRATNRLVRLRYLSVQGDFDLIPASVGNLKNLETLCVKELRGEVVRVPDCIWDMAKLRHVHINDSASFDIEPHRLEDSSTILDNLQTFSTPILAYGDDTGKILRRVRGIQKLKCIFLDSWDDAENCNKFPVLEFLDKLVSLKVLYNGGRIYPCIFSFPSNLRELTLSNFHMPWNEISQLAAACQNLEILKLLSDAFDGETWEMEEDVVFPKLRFLKLDTLNVVTWSACRENFPRLQRLLLNKCEQLEEIPPDIGEIPTLDLIEVMWCNSSAAISAMNILEEQQDYNVVLKVNIHPKLLDSELSSQSE